jgi:hypothetical protein
VIGAVTKVIGVITKTDGEKAFIFCVLLEETRNDCRFPGLFEIQERSVQGPAYQFGPEIEIALEPLECQTVHDWYEEIRNQSKNNH